MESVDYANEDYRVMSGTRRRTRLSLALGGGLSVVNGEVAALGALTGRVELGGRTRFGLEGSLWLVDGLSGQGSLLGTASVRGIARRFELAIGSGLRITGDAAGPAFNLTLRTRLPLPGVSTYLRYDGALLLHDGTYDGQNAGSVGVEASF
jgi:hypothetical protein